MLTKTFCHVQGIGRDTKRQLWNQGCDSWDQYLADPQAFSVGSAAREIVEGTLLRSRDALALGEYQYFKKVLSPSEAWRAWPDFRSECVYLDIETDGGNSGNAVTTIGLFDGKDFQCLVKGDNLGNFRDVISHYSMIVTFFGTGFDLPMLQKCFRGIVFDQIHLDLCYALKRLGYRGGLKKIEKQLGFCRADEAEGLDGRDAIRLWREYQRGREDSLKTLIAYNREDVVNLEGLAQIAFDGLQKQAILGEPVPADYR